MIELSHKRFRIAGTALAAVAAMLIASGSALAKTALVVYTALEDEQLPVFKKAFEAANPDIEIKWVRDSTGTITARLLAEKANRQADAVWGLAASSLLVLDKEGMLEPYAPAGVDKLKANYKDAANPPRWVGMDAWASAICLNTEEQKQHNL